MVKPGVGANEDKNQSPASKNRKDGEQHLCCSGAQKFL